MKLTLLAVLISAVSISSCGGSSDSDPATGQSALSGVFVDSPVQGLAYSAGSESGVTDQDGTIRYMEGDQVAFSIGSLDLPSFDAMSVMTPLDVFGGAEPSDLSVVNLSRLLQSLDEDSNPENGITISTAAASSAPEIIDFGQTDEDFSADAGVLNLVANSGAENTELVSSLDASRHLQASLADLGELEAFGVVDYTDLIIGNTTTYTNEGNSYYYRPDGVRFAVEDGVAIETTWRLDESGAICEVTSRGTDFCIADAVGLLLTKAPGSDVYNYSDETYVGVFTVAPGDTQGLASSSQ